MAVWLSLYLPNSASYYALNSTQLSTEKNCGQYISLHALYCIRSPSINPTGRKELKWWLKEDFILQANFHVTSHINTNTSVLQDFFMINSFASNKFFLILSILRTFYVVPIRTVQFCTIVRCSTAKTNLSCHLKALLADRFERRESEFASYCKIVKQNDAFYCNTNHYKSVTTIFTFALLFILQMELCFS